MPRCKSLDEARGPYKFEFTLSPDEVIPFLRDTAKLESVCRQKAIEIYWLERYPTVHKTVPNIGMLVYPLFKITWTGEHYLVQVDVQYCEVDC